MQQSSTSAASVDTDVLSSRAAREGERKHLTVLIADIAGSTALVDRLDPEEAAHRLGAIVAQMREAVARFEGTVTKLQGDGIVALFGAPILLEDHAVRACCAGLAMVENVRRIEGAPPVRVGVNTGDVVVRAMSTDLSKQYEAMGRTVHIAARLEEEAPDFTVLISDSTLHATAGLVDADYLGARHLRGVSANLPVHALRKIRSAASSQQFRISQKLSPFVNRQTEYLALKQALDEATANTSPVVGITGEAGSGKSRLVFEFLDGCRAQGCPVLEARATGYGRATLLRPILDLARTIFGIDEATSNEEAAGQVRATLHRYGLGQDLPLYLDFLGLPVDRRALPADVAVRHLRLLEAVRRISRAFATARPAVVVLEDLHWLDPASEPFVDALVKSIAGTKTLMLVTFRPGYDRDWMAQPFFRRVALAALHADAVEAMLSGALDANPTLLPLRPRIIERAGGNPLFAEELTRAAIERQGEQRRSQQKFGKLRDPAAVDVALPATIESVLGSRIDRLPDPDKQLLQAASVIGQEFSLSAVPDVAAMSMEQARASLQRLVTAEMLYEKLDVRRSDFGFRHPLVQEAAYGSLLSEQRSRLHRAAAAALSVEFRERLDEYSALIAHHWELGGDELEAANNYVRSAIWIGARDPRQALETWRVVRRLLQKQPSTPTVDFMLLMACGNVINYARWQGIDPAEVEPAFKQSIDLAHKLKDMRAATLLTMAFGRILLATASADHFVAKVEEAQTFSRESANPSVEAVLQAVYCYALTAAGLLQRALEANDRALACVHQIDVPDRQMLGFDPEQWLKAERARILMLLGRHAESDAILDELLDGRAIDTVHLVNALGTRIEAARKNRTSCAREAERLRAALKGNETPYLKVLGNRFKAIALLADDAAQEAVDLLSHTIEYARVQKVGLELEPYLLTTLAEGLAVVGSSDARAVALEASDLARRRAMRVAEEEADRLLKARASRAG